MSVHRDANSQKNTEKEWTKVLAKAPLEREWRDGTRGTLTSVLCVKTTFTVYHCIV